MNIRDDFCIKITEDNKEELKELFNSVGYSTDGFLFSVGAYYGLKEGYFNGRTADHQWSKVLTIEEFKQYYLVSHYEVY